MLLSRVFIKATTIFKNSQYFVYRTPNSETVSLTTLKLL